MEDATSCVPQGQDGECFEHACHNSHFARMRFNNLKKQARKDVTTIFFNTDKSRRNGTNEFWEERERGKLAKSPALKGAVKSRTPYLDDFP